MSFVSGHSYAHTGSIAYPLHTRYKTAPKQDMLSIVDRNTATEKQLSILNVLQKLNTKLIINKVGKESRLSQLKTLCEALQ